MRRFYGQNLWILQKFAATNLDLHHGLLGEIIPQGKFSLTVTSPVPAFGLIVTAEPYFAVSQPSDLVVMQNVILQDETAGVLEHVNAHYTLLARGTYTQEVAASPTSRPR